MNQIGFKNFRRFKELAPIDLNPLTIFVGENNAGKSTVVKALLVVIDFIKTRVSALENDSWLNMNFYFNKSHYTHLGTFDRARNNQANEDDPITFTFSFADRRYEIDIMKSDSAAGVFGRIYKIKMTLLPLNIDFTFSLTTDRRINVVFHATPYPGYNPDEITQDLKPSTINRYFKGLTKDIEIEMTINPELRFTSEYIVDALLLSFKTQFFSTLNKLNSKKALIANTDLFLSDEAQQFLLNKRAVFNKNYFKNNKQADIDVEYIYAHAVTQNLIFNASDVKGYHDNAVHDFVNQQIDKGSILDTKIENWMHSFRIGLGYNILSEGGEAHIVRILNFDGKEVNLADKGMGSIQLMILLFRIATKISEAGILFHGKKSNTILIIEEPEQNLHPMLQSKLADFFYSLYKEYGFRFIIETHSEYLIRNTQVLVNNGFKSDPDFVNPFKVIYYPSDDKAPYDMIYREDGKFSNEFGTGFFDEAANLAFEIF